jgi:hypothetical protein
LHSVRASDGLHAWLRKTEVLDLTFANKILHGACDIFDRHVRIHSMLIEQIDDIYLETFERAFGHLLDVLGPTIEAAALLPVRIDVETELRGDHHSVADGSQCFANERFVRERTINLRGIEKGNAALHSGANQRDHLLRIGGRTVTKAHPHATQTERGDFQVTVSQFPLLHRRISWGGECCEKVAS